MKLSFKNILTTITGKDQQQQPLSIPTPLTRDGRIDWEAIPSGAAITTTVKHEGHPLHGRSLRIARKGDKLVVMSDAGTEHPFAIPHETSPANPARGAERALNERARGVRESLHAAYGQEHLVGQWHDQATQAATAAGVDPERAGLIGLTIAEALRDHGERRRFRLIDEQRLASATLLAQHFNKKLEQASAAGKASKYAYVREGTGVQVDDFPRTAQQWADAANPQQSSADEPDALEIALDSSFLKRLQYMPLGEVARLVNRYILDQIITEEDFSGAPPSQDIYTTLLTLPPVVPAKSPEYASATLKLHSVSDSMEAAQHQFDPRLSVLVGQDDAADKFSEYLLSPHLALTSLSQQASANSVNWEDEQLLLASKHSPAFLGDAVSRGMRTALTEAGKHEYLQFAAVLPPVALAQLARLDQHPDEDALIEHVLSAGNALWDQFEAASSAEQWVDAAKALSALSDGTGVLLGYLQLQQVQLPAFQEGARLHAVFGDMPEAAVAFAAWCRNAIPGGEQHVIHTGQQFVVDLTMADIQALATIPQPRPGKNQLLAHHGGIIPSSDVDEWGDLLATMLLDKETGINERLAIICPDYLTNQLYDVLREQTGIPNILILGGAKKPALGNLVSTLILIAGYRTASAYPDILHAFRPWGMVLVEPPFSAAASLPDWAMTLLRIPVQFRALVLERDTLTRWQLVPTLARWIERADPRRYLGAFGKEDVVTTTYGLPVHQRGFGAKTAASIIAERRNLARLDAVLIRPEGYYDRQVTLAITSITNTQEPSRLAERLKKVPTKPGALALGATRERQKREALTTSATDIERAYLQELWVARGDEVLNAVMQHAANGRRNVYLVRDNIIWYDLIQRLEQTFGEDAVIDGTNWGVETDWQKIWHAGQGNHLIITEKQQASLHDADAFHALFSPQAAVRLLTKETIRSQEETAPALAVYGYTFHASPLPLHWLQLDALVHFLNA